MSQTLPKFYYFANWTLRHLLFPLARVQVAVEGVEYVPSHGALIVAMNHLSMLDPMLMGAFIPRDIEMMSKSEAFEGKAWLRWIVRSYGAFPIRRGEGDVGAIRHAMKSLRQGRALLVAPEGTRSKSGRLGEPYEGIALLAVRSGAAILPVGISGVEGFPAGLEYLRPRPVRISIGKPFYLASAESKPDKEMLRAMSEAVMERIAAELPPAYRGRFAIFSERQQFIREWEQGRGVGNLTDISGES